MDTATDPKTPCPFPHQLAGYTIKTITWGEENKVVMFNKLFSHHKEVKDRRFNNC
jgi:hypothetical protein